MDELAKQAIEVLHRNDRGSWTRPSPRLYPHQWSWDAAFVAMGWAQLDPLRGIAELWSLLKERFPDDQLLELIVTAGWYRLLSYIINAARIPLEPWAARFPEATADPRPAR